MDGNLPLELGKITGMLEVLNVRKQFGPVTALRGVTLQFRAGEVHGLIGENGAGKSTLMKLLSGLELPTEGEVRWEGAPVVFSGVRAAMDRGISMIHQELNLVDDLTVAENIHLGREPKRGFLLDREAMNTGAAALLKRVGARIEPQTLVGGLSIADKQLVEIAKAVGSNAKFLIMDEPTAVLTAPEVAALFALIRELRADGVGIIYISHLLPEVIEISDRISVLRDGEFVIELDPKTATPRQLAESMVGRELGEVFPEKRPTEASRVVLDVQNLSTGPHHQAVSFQVREGEIVGMAGLIGAGRTEIGEAIAGYRPANGTVRVNDVDVSGRSPQARMQAGVAYVSEDRKQRGLHLTLGISDNITLPTLGQFGQTQVNISEVRKVGETWITDIGIRTSGPDAAVKSLSGGNQQKVSIAKWLQGKPSVIIFDEPTRGVDVGAKREIYNLIVRLASEGLAVVVISSELPEVIGLCHRVLVLRNGHCEGDLRGEELTEQRIMALASGTAGGVA